MRKILLVAFLVLTFSVSAQVGVAKRTTAGRGYLEYLADQKTSRAIIYLHGSGETGDGSTSGLQKVRVHGLCWYLEQGAKIPFHVFAPQQSAGKYGYNDGMVLQFMNDIRKQYGITDFILTGFSMGADGSYWTAAKDTTGLIRAIIPVAPTNTDYKTALSVGKKNIPVRVFWGANDSWKNGGRTIIYTQAPKGYQDGGGRDLQQVIFPTGGHDAGTWKQVYGNLDIKWLQSLCIPEKSGEDIPVKRAYLSKPENVLVIEFENGERWEFKPPQ